jgi:hypothetical protein
MTTPEPDSECQVCHRITLSYETNKLCPGCSWPIRPVTLSEPVAGFDVAVRVRVGNFESKIVRKNFWTTDEKEARRRAKRTRSFVEVAAVLPLTERQYLGAYGDPRDKSKFS